MISTTGFSSIELEGPSRNVHEAAGAGHSTPSNKRLHHRDVSFRDHALYDGHGGNLTLRIYLQPITAGSSRPDPKLRIFKESKYFPGVRIRVDRQMDSPFGNRNVVAGLDFCCRCWFRQKFSPL